MKRSCKTCLYDLNFGNYEGYCDTCTNHCNYNSIVEKAVCMLKESGMEIKTSPETTRLWYPVIELAPGDTVIIIRKEGK
jgi:hypothetical protein